MDFDFNYLSRSTFVASISTNVSFVIFAFLCQFFFFFPFVLHIYYMVAFDFDDFVRYVCVFCGYRFR